MTGSGQRRAPGGPPGHHGGMALFSAWIGITRDVVDGEYCRLAVQTVDTGALVYSIELDIGIDDPDRATKAPIAAAELLAGAGWQMTGPWASLRYTQQVNVARTAR